MAHILKNNKRDTKQIKRWKLREKRRKGKITLARFPADKL